MFQYACYIRSAIRAAVFAFLIDPEKRWMETEAHGTATAQPSSPSLKACSGRFDAPRTGYADTGQGLKSS
jgi:hypothetical protein